MPAGNTYEAIAIATASGTPNVISFTSIPSTYTDLILISNPASTSAGDQLVFRLNSTATNTYSWTGLYGDGTTAGSGREISSVRTYGTLNYYSAPNSSLGNQITISHFMNYSNTTTYKTVLSRGNNANSGYATDAIVALWQGTSAISQIDLYCNNLSRTFVNGSTFSLYGIKAA